MAFSVTFTPRNASLAKAVREFASVSKAAIPGLLDDAGRYMVRTHIPEVFATSGAAAGESWPSVGRGGQPLLDTGTLRRSFGHMVTGKRLTISTPLPYAGLQNEGGTVRPVRAKKLTIPASSLSISERRTFKARGYKDAFVTKSKAGNLVLMQRTSSGLRLLATLVDESIIPRRTFLTWSQRAQNEIIERWAIALAGEA